MLLLIFCIITLVSNFILASAIYRMSEMLEEKLADFAMLEKRLQHYFDDADSAFAPERVHW